MDIMLILPGETLSFVCLHIELILSANNVFDLHITLALSAHYAYLFMHITLVMSEHEACFF